MPAPRAKKEAYGQKKDANLYCRITPEAYNMIESRAARLGLSRSEYVERGMRWLESHWDRQLQREIGDGQEEG